MEENNANPVENTPTSSGSSGEEVGSGSSSEEVSSGSSSEEESGSDGGGGSGEVNDARNVNGRPPLGVPTSSPSPGMGGGEVSGEGNEMKVHEFWISPGQDVHGLIILLANSRKRTITIISCNGSVSSIGILSPGSAGGGSSYEGVFEILNLNGTFTNVGIGGSGNISGTMTVSLARPNGEVLGGHVCGPMTAAGLIQLVLVSFVQVRRPPIINLPFLRRPPPPPPPPANTVQVSEPNVSSIQQVGQLQDALSSSLRLDPPSSTNTPVTSVARNPNDGR